MTPTYPLGPVPGVQPSRPQKAWSFPTPQPLPALPISPATRRHAQPFPPCPRRSALHRPGWWVLVSLVVALSFAAPAPAAEATWESDQARFTVGSSGTLSTVSLRGDSRNRAAAGPGAPLLSLRLRNEVTFRAPSSASWDAARRRLELRYPEPALVAVVQVDAKPTHVRLELIEIRPVDAVSRVAVALWGPYPLDVAKTVGEVVGVVRDDDVAVGLQALNPKTLGGYPENDEGSADRPYAARKTERGSVLQAYSLDRSQPRQVDVWGKRAPNMPVTPVPGETVIGSAIALFACPPAMALERLGQIEVAEGLPHPMIDGIWAKVSPERGRSYLIADFSESDIDEMLGYVKRADLMSLYHGNPFKSWGHYQPNPKFFPQGVAGVKQCADKARALGIRLGAHTLSNFINTHDSYVTPVPDPRLVQTGASVLTDDIDATARDLPVASPEYFSQRDRNELHTVVIGQELVRYRSVSAGAPWKLLDCERGAYGTRVAAHPKGAAVGKLMDHSYKVFFPNLELQAEIARGLAELFKETGLSHLDFDGHEGCLASGQGTYGNELFAREFYDHAGHTVINGTSPPLSHFYWHINSYCNWGEPWYGGFRDSMQEYRINNQAFCERNYLPKMLGWYLLTPNTCLSDMEWMLARAAGFDAGFALATSPSALRRNPDSGRILDSLREWEHARRSGAIPTELRAGLRDPKKEFHLETRPDGGWNLYPFHASPEFAHEQLVRQPGEPTGASWDVSNPDARQPVQFKLRVQGTNGAIANPTLEIAQSATLRIPVEVRAGQSLLVEADAVARIYDAKGNSVKTVPLTNALPVFVPGKNPVQFSCDFEGEPVPRLVVTFKTRGEPHRVGH